MPECIVVANSFHLKPLLRIVQSADRYQLLAIDRKHVSLYEGTRDVLGPIDLTDVPATIEAALGTELTEPMRSFRGAGPYRSGGVGGFFGSGQKKDEIDIDLERFFRVVDRAVTVYHSRPTGLPQNVAAFRAVSHNALLLDAAIEQDPASLGIEALRRKAWRKVEPTYLARLADLEERCNAHATAL